MYMNMGMVRVIIRHTCMMMRVIMVMRVVMVNIMVMGISIHIAMVMVPCVVW